MRNHGVDTDRRRHRDVTVTSQTVVAQTTQPLTKRDRALKIVRCCLTSSDKRLVGVAFPLACLDELRVAILNRKAAVRIRLDRGEALQDAAAAAILAETVRTEYAKQVTSPSSLCLGH